MMRIIDSFLVIPPLLLIRMLASYAQEAIAGGARSVRIVF
jgi:ABC-type dipeptide/oligopeptide/nickel transport system permease subunit